MGFLSYSDYLQTQPEYFSRVGRGSTPEDEYGQALPWIDFRAEWVKKLLEDPNLEKIRPVSTGEGSASKLFFKDGTTKTIPRKEMGGYLYYFSPDLVKSESAGPELDRFTFADGTTDEALSPRVEAKSGNFFESGTWGPYAIAAAGAGMLGGAAYGAYGAGGLGGAGSGSLAGDIGAFGGVIGEKAALEGAALGAGSTYGTTGSGMMGVAGGAGGSALAGDIGAFGGNITADAAMEGATLGSGSTYETGGGLTALQKLQLAKTGLGAVSQLAGGGGGGGVPSGGGLMSGNYGAGTTDSQLRPPPMPVPQYTQQQPNRFIQNEEPWTKKWLNYGHLYPYGA